MKSIIILLLIGTLHLKTSTQRKLRFLKLGGNCGNFSDVKAIFVVHQIVEQNFQINGTLKVTEDFPDDAAAEIEFERCRSVENPNTCEHFHGLRLQRFCRLNLREFLNYEPPLVVHLKKENIKCLL